MFLEDDILEDGKSGLDSEREVRREVISDLKQVYYRGRYRASVAWSKVGGTSTTVIVPPPEKGHGPQERVVGRHAENKPKCQPLVS
jgi:hypothetical protein